MPNESDNTELQYRVEELGAAVETALQRQSRLQSRVAAGEQALLNAVSRLRSLEVRVAILVAVLTCVVVLFVIMTLLSLR